MAQVDLLTETQASNIGRMVNGDSLVRIGPIWYGTDNMVTVPSLRYMTNKQVDIIPVLRAESAVAFASSRSPIDTIQIELVIHYSRFASHIQKLVALSQVNPVVPVMNPVIALLTQPIGPNKEVYVAYGYDEASTYNMEAATTDTEAGRSARDRAIRMYCSVPVQCRIDNIRISSMPGASRDLQVLVTVTRILTANTYGDRVQYVKTLADAVSQFQYIDGVTRALPDTPQVKAISRIVGVDYEKLEEMLQKLKDQAAVFEGDVWVDAVLETTISGDTITVRRGTSAIPINIRLAGIRAPQCNATSIGHISAQPLGYQSRNRLLNLIRANTGIQMKRTGSITIGTSSLPVCIIRFSSDGRDPILTMLREGMVRYTGDNLPDSMKTDYQRAEAEATTPPVGLHALPSGG